LRRSTTLPKTAGDKAKKKRGPPEDFIIKVRKNVGAKTADKGNAKQMLSSEVLINERDAVAATFVDSKEVRLAK
jgi:hypothetical protein